MNEETDVILKWSAQIVARASQELARGDGPARLTPATAEAMREALDLLQLRDLVERQALMSDEENVGRVAALVRAGFGADFVRSELDAWEIWARELVEEVSEDVPGHPDIRRARAAPTVLVRRAPTTEEKRAFLALALTTTTTKDEDT